MIRKRIPMGLTVGLMAVAITGGAVLASCGSEAGNGDRDVEEGVVKDGDVSTLSIDNTEVKSEEPDELAVRVAEILGTDPHATYDAMVQADQVDLGRVRVDGRVEAGTADSWSEEATGMSYAEYGKRIGATLDMDGMRIARAVAQAYEELYGVERDILENGSGRDAGGKEDPDKHPAAPADG